MRRRLGVLERIGPADSTTIQIKGEFFDRLEVRGGRIIAELRDAPGWSRAKFNRGLHHVAFNFLAFVSSPDVVLGGSFDSARRYIRSPKKGEVWSYLAALLLPDVDSDSAGDPPFGEPDLTKQEEEVMDRLGAFPTPDYWRLDGDGRDGGEKVEDSIARDLFMTYTAIRPGLDELDRDPERRAWTIWSWRYSFWAAWGMHAANATQALQKYYHDRAWSDD